MTSRMAMSLQRSSLASKDSPLLTLSQKRLLSTWERFTICPMLLVPVLMSRSHCCSAVQKRLILRASTELMGTRKREQLRFAASNRMGLSVSNTVSLSNLNTLGYPIFSRGVEYCISLASIRKRFRGSRPLSAHQRWEFRPPPMVFIVSERPYDLLVTPSKLSPVWLGTALSRKMFAVSPKGTPNMCWFTNFLLACHHTRRTFRSIRSRQPVQDILINTVNVNNLPRGVHIAIDHVVLRVMRDQNITHSNVRRATAQYVHIVGEPS